MLKYLRGYGRLVLIHSQLYVKPLDSLCFKIEHNNMEPEHTTINHVHMLVVK